MTKKFFLEKCVSNLIFSRKIGQKYFKSSEEVLNATSNTKSSQRAKHLRKWKKFQKVEKISLFAIFRQKIGFWHKCGKCSMFAIYGWILLRPPSERPIFMIYGIFAKALKNCRNEIKNFKFRKSHWFFFSIFDYYSHSKILIMSLKDTKHYSPQ